MYPASTSFAQAIASGQYQVANSVRFVMPSGQQFTLPAEGGAFTVDRTAAQRRSGSLTIAPTAGLLEPGDLIPTNFGDPLTPTGILIYPSFGITYPASAGGGTELVPMGCYTLVDTDIDVTAADVTITLSISDLSWAVSQRKFLNPYQVTSSNPITAVGAILATQYPQLAPLAGTNVTGVTLPSPLPTFKEGDDPWTGCQQIAANCGYELFIDLFGYPQMRPIPTPSNNPLAANLAFTEGGTGGNGITEVKRRFTRDGISNDFIVSGSGTTVQPPVRAEAAVTDGTNPMYVGSPPGNTQFGDIPTFLTSSLVTTTAAAQVAANLALAQSIGNVETIDFTVLPDPRWDIDDIANLTVGRANINGFNYVIDTIRHSFDHKTGTEMAGRRVH